MPLYLCVNKKIMKITIIGISDREPEFTRKKHILIQSVRHFAGGSRHRELVDRLLPDGHKWQDIVVPLSNLYQVIDNSKKDWVVFASGDPLFYGIGISLKREFPKAEIIIDPDFNSLQLLAHRFQLPYGEFQTISLTGRTFEQFDKALMEGKERMGILTDRNNTPKSIAERMLHFGYSNYKIYYGECLGGENERVNKISLNDALQLKFKHPNCFYLEKTDGTIPRKGIPENEFESLDGRPNMITKMSIRLTTLSLMQLQDKAVFWDVGACTGSVSIETRLNYPHLKVTAFEIRTASEGIIQRNAQKFQTPGINLFIGDYLKTKKVNLEKPDAVFIGGYGGKMEAILNDVNAYLKDKGVLAFNSVSKQSKLAFLDWCKKNNFSITAQTLITVDTHNPVTVLVAKK